MKKNILVCAFLFFTVFTANSQTVKKTENLQQIWLGYFNQARFSNKWGMWTDLNLRTKEDFVNNLSVSIVRVGLTYYLTTDTKLTAGYAWINFFPGDNHKNISQPEHRPWQQVQWHTKYGRQKMMQWIRLEERFRHKILNDDALAPGYNFNFKVRYNLWYEIPVGKKIAVPGAISIILNDEVHVSFGKQVVYNYFDQNRFFAGVKLQTAKTSNLQFGYMNVFQQLSAGNQYKNINGMRLFFFQNIDLRKDQ
jgi:Protein of unknown function (DUF2490)